MNNDRLYLDAVTRRRRSLILRLCQLQPHEFHEFFARRVANPREICPCPECAADGDDSGSDQHERREDSVPPLGPLVRSVQQLPRRNSLPILFPPNAPPPVLPPPPQLPARSRYTRWRQQRHRYRVAFLANAQEARGNLLAQLQSVQAGWDVFWLQLHRLAELVLYPAAWAALDVLGKMCWIMMWPLLGVLFVISSILPFVGAAYLLLSLLARTPFGPYVVHNHVAPVICHQLGPVAQWEASYGLGLCIQRPTSDPASPDDLDLEKLGIHFHNVSQHSAWDAALGLSMQVYAHGQEVRTARLDLVKVSAAWRAAPPDTVGHERVVSALWDTIGILNHHANSMSDYGNHIVTAHAKLIWALTSMKDVLLKANGNLDKWDQDKIIKHAKYAQASMAKLLAQTNQIRDLSQQTSSRTELLQDILATVRHDLSEDHKKACAQARVDFNNLWFFQRYFRTLELPPEPPYQTDLRNTSRACSSVYIEIDESQSVLAEHQSVWTSLIEFLEMTSLETIGGSALQVILQIIEESLIEWNLKACKAKVDTDARRGLDNQGFMPPESAYAHCYTQPQIDGTKKKGGK